MLAPLLAFSINPLVGNFYMLSDGPSTQASAPIKSKWIQNLVPFYMLLVSFIFSEM